MAIPTSKSVTLEDTLKDIFGINRIESIKADKCTTCGKDAAEFRDEVSRREFRISGMCQTCQDSIFGE